MNRRTATAALAAGGMLVGLGTLTGQAGAAITDPVQYVVGGTADGEQGVRVFFDRTRNTSCSVSRMVANETGLNIRTLMWVTWDGQSEPVFPELGTSAMDGDDDLAPGEVGSITFTNHDHISDTATGMLLHTAWMLQGESIVVAQHAEPIEPCRAAEPPPVDTAPPTVDTTPPSVPPSVVEEVPGPELTPPSEPGPGPSTPTTTAGTAETGVLTSRTMLPATGQREVAQRLLLAGILIAAGIVGLTIAATVKDDRRLRGDRELRFPKEGER